MNRRRKHRQELERVRQAVAERLREPPLRIGVDIASGVDFEFTQAEMALAADPRLGEMIARSAAQMADKIDGEMLKVYINQCANQNPQNPKEPQKL